jgi:hypothetical protein
MLAQLIHGDFQRLAASWTVFNMMPVMRSIRGGEGGRHSIGAHLERPIAVLTSPRKGGHTNLLFFSNIHNISRKANP